MNWFKSTAKSKTIEFLKYLEILEQSSGDRSVDGFRGKEPEQKFIKQIIVDTWELIDHNEWGVGLENLLSNLYEIDFKLDAKAIQLAKDAIQSCEMDYDKLKFIEELKMKVSPK